MDRRSAARTAPVWRGDGEARVTRDLMPRGAREPGEGAPQSAVASGGAWVQTPRRRGRGRVARGHNIATQSAAGQEPFSLGDFERKLLQNFVLKCTTL
jgi:hypothetical protein